MAQLIARFFCVLLALHCPVAWPAPPATEYEVKAAYLFHFGQFVDWPPEAFDSPDAPFVIGVVGTDPFGETIDAFVRGESLAGRPYVIRRFKDAGDITDCNILFIARSERGRLDDTLRAVRGRSVLTVTDIAGAETRGAIIALVNDRSRVRMRINLAAARASNLVISSKLLRPAEVVNTGAADP